MYVKLFFLVATIFFNVACGQKGPLMLTQPASPEANKTQTSEPLDNKQPRPVKNSPSRESREQDSPQGIKP